MTMISRFTVYCCAIAVLALAGQSAARAADFYIGGAAHLAKADWQSVDDTDSTTSVTLGYAFIDSVVIVAGELSRYDLGGFSENGNDIEADAVAVAGVVALGLGPFFEIYGKVGVADIDLDINGSNRDGTENFSGFGMGFDFFDTVDLFVEYLEFDNEIDSELLGIGLRLDF